MTVQAVGVIAVVVPKADACANQSLPVIAPPARSENVLYVGNTTFDSGMRHS